MQKRGKLCFCYSMLKSSYFCDPLVSFSTVHFNYHRSTHTSNTNKIKRSLYPLEEKNLILFIPKKIPFKITSRSSQGIVKRSFEVEASTRRYYANNENFVSRAEFTWNHSCVLHCSQKLFVRRDGCLGRWPFVSRG